MWTSLSIFSRSQDAYEFLKLNNHLQDILGDAACTPVIFAKTPRFAVDPSKRHGPVYNHMASRFGATYDSPVAGAGGSGTGATQKIVVENREEKDEDRALGRGSNILQGLFVCGTYSRQDKALTDKAFARMTDGYAVIRGMEGLRAQIKEAKRQLDDANSLDISSDSQLVLGRCCPSILPTVAQGLLRGEFYTGDYSPDYPVMKNEVTFYHFFKHGEEIKAVNSNQMLALSQGRPLSLDVPQHALITDLGQLWEGVANVKSAVSALVMCIGARSPLVLKGLEELYTTVHVNLRTWVKRYIARMPYFPFVASRRAARFFALMAKAGASSTSEVAVEQGVIADFDWKTVTKALTQLRQFIEDMENCERNDKPWPRDNVPSDCPPQLLTIEEARPESPPKRARISSPPAQEARARDPQVDRRPAPSAFQSSRRNHQGDRRSSYGGGDARREVSTSSTRNGKKGTFVLTAEGQRVRFGALAESLRNKYCTNYFLAGVEPAPGEQGLTTYFTRWAPEDQDLQIGYVRANRGMVAFWEHAHASVHRTVRDRNLFTTGGLNRRGEVN